MKSILPLFALALAAVPVATAQEPIVIEQYQNIAPEFKCHHKRNKKTFCRMFPNFSRRHDICDPLLMGHIVWCTEDIVVTDRDDCGNFETYDAVVVTYRKVYENGAWGEKFKRTYRKEPALVVPPLAKNVIK